MANVVLSFRERELPPLKHEGCRVVLCGVSLGPQSGYSVVLLAVLSVLRRDTSNQWVSRVAICEKGAYG